LFSRNNSKNPVNGYYVTKRGIFVKTLIAVRGVANRGKSDSIKKAYKLLVDAYPAAVVEKFVFRADIKIIVTIKGVKVGIESQGDPTDRLPESLRYFAEAGCKVIICATRTRGETVDAVNDLSSQYDIEWIEKSEEPDAQKKESANRAVAQEIFEKTQSAIDA